ncbi:unnamed protein product [Schistosoma spindalis]|nr:unnamed protein product [Schistosoma spindale]
MKTYQALTHLAGTTPSSSLMSAYIIEEWFYNNQNINLYDYLCRENVLDKSSQGCLDEKSPNQPKHSPESHQSDEL